MDIKGIMRRNFKEIEEYSKDCLIVQLMLRNMMDNSQYDWKH